jgi:hypothetical protein
MKCLFSLILLLSSFSLYSMKLPENSVYVPSKLGNLKVLVEQDGYYVKSKDTLKKVQNYDVDPLLKKIDKEALKAFLDKGYISVSQFDNGEYKLTAHGRVKGGGPISGWIGYWGTKTLAWGTISLAATASIKALAVKAGISVGAKTAVAATKMATGAKGLAVTVGEEIVEQAVGEAGAKTIVGSVMAHVPGAAMVATKIETAASVVGGALYACPWLP